MKILEIDAYQIFDSRGNPTVEARVTVEKGLQGRGSVAAGASTGKYEALELRDRDPLRFRGRSVFQAIDNIKGEIGHCLRGRDITDQTGIDRVMIELDGTGNKSRLGANAILAVSMACCSAAARLREEQLFEYLGRGEGDLIPLPEIQIIGGGAHAGRAIDVQDFMVVAVGAEHYQQALEMTFNVYHETAGLLEERGLLYGLADEGGFWPVVDCNEDVFDLLLVAIERAGYIPGEDMALSLDLAASDLYREGRYVLASEGRTLTTEELLELLLRWTDRYPVISIEDPMGEDDWAGWQLVRENLGNRVQIIGDDLFTTNVERITEGMRRQAANAVLIKLNQIGTVTETIQAVQTTQEGGWLPVISARSGETEDTFIAHLAVALNSGQLKVGAFARGERTAKWNELLRIEHSLGSRARFIGSQVYEKLGIVPDWRR